jgi:hypothetical protein
MFWRLAPDILLYGVKLIDPSQRLRRQRRASRLLDLIELSPRVHPADCQNDIAVRHQALEAGISIDVKTPLNLSRYAAGRSDFRSSANK